MTWEVEVETQDGPQEPPLKIYFPCALTFPKSGRGWKEGETISALYAYGLRGGHWRMHCCVQGRAGVPEVQLRRLAAFVVTGVRGWADHAEEHMSYGWLQVHTRAKEEQRRHLGKVGGSVKVDREEGGEEEGDDASSLRSCKRGGSKGKVGRPCKVRKLPAKYGAQPSTSKPPPAKQAAAHVDALVAAQARAMPEWQKRAVAAEGEVLLLGGRTAGAGGGAAGNGGGAGTGPPPGTGPQTQAEGGRARAATGRAHGRVGGKGRGWGLVRSTLWRGARRGRPGQRR